MRTAFGKTLVEIAENDKRVVVLSGDYESNIGDFIKKYPDRYFNIGTCEQSTVSMAAGMAIEGLIPVVYSITPFLLERAFEQVKIGLDQQNIHVILVGYDDYPTQGPTHTALNPQAMTALLKNTRGYFPRNSAETTEVLRDAYKRSGPSIICLKRDSPAALGRRP